MRLHHWRGHKIKDRVKKSSSLGLKEGTEVDCSFLEWLLVVWTDRQTDRQTALQGLIVQPTWQESGLLIGFRGKVWTLCRSHV